MRKYSPGRRPLAVAFLALLLTALAPVMGFAQADNGPSPNVFILPTQSVQNSVTSIVPERIGELLREQVEKDDRVELMPDYKSLRAQLGGSSAAVAQAEKMYTSGIGLLTAGEDKKAADTFQRALDMMEQNLADLSNYDVLADTLVNLSLAYFNAGFDLDARKRMQQYAHMRPDQTLDPEKYPKELIEIYQDEAKKVKAAGPGKLVITASSKDALVFIDGVERGKAPATVSDVGFGYHYLVVRSASGSVFAEQIRVRGRNKKQDFKAELEGGAQATGTDSAEDANALPPFYTDLLGTIEQGTIGTELAPYLKELAGQTGAASVAWVVMFKEDGKYVAAHFAYRASDGLIVRGEDVQFNLELSNLLVGVSTLSSRVVDLVLAMPEDQAVTSIQLGKSPQDVATTTTTTTETGTATAGGTDLSTKKETTIKEPPKAKPSEARNTWTYVGIAAGGLAVVGLVAGGIFLLSSDGGGSSAPGFNAEVSW